MFVSLEYRNNNNNLKTKIMKTIINLDVQAKALIIGALVLTVLFTVMINLYGFSEF